MKITICASMSFAMQIMDVQRRLAEAGHSVFAPDGAEDYVLGHAEKSRSEGAKRKIARDLIRQHHEYIRQSDAILVLNYDKKGIRNYLGGNTFLEMGFAFVLGKTIYLLHEGPEIDFFKEEIIAMQPVVLHGDLSIIPAKVATARNRKAREIGRELEAL